MKFRIIILLSLMSICRLASSANEDGAADLGVDYAFMSLMTLSTDFAAANYTIHNDDGLDVDISIARLPFHLELIKNESSDLQLEVAFASQRTTEIIPTSHTPGENISAEWDTYGADLGLIYDINLAKDLYFTPSVRLGVTKMRNQAEYNGAFANSIKDIFDNILFNWTTNARVLNLGLGLRYDWKLLDRSSSINANVYRIAVDSYNESNSAVSFSENANMLTVKGDMIFPTDYPVFGDRLDLVLMLGATNFFGENRHTLGYTTSYQAGVGAELPLKIKQKKYGYVRLSGAILWANNMKGWLLTIGYTPE